MRISTYNYFCQEGIILITIYLSVCYNGANTTGWNFVAIKSENGPWSNLDYIKNESYLDYCMDSNKNK